MLNMFQVVIWEEPAILAVGHLPIFYEESRVVVQDGDVRNERVLRTTVRSHSEPSSPIDRVAYFSIVGRRRGGTNDSRTNPARGNHPEILTVV